MFQLREKKLLFGVAHNNFCETFQKSESHEKGKGNVSVTQTEVEGMASGEAGLQRGLARGDVYVDTWCN